MGQIGQLPRAPTKIRTLPQRWKMSCSFYINVIFRPYFEWNLNASKTHLTRVGHILKKSHIGHLGVFFDPQKEIVITSELLRIFQPNFTGVSHIWSGIWKYVKFFFSKMAANMAAEIPNRMYLSYPFEYRDK